MSVTFQVRCREQYSTSAQCTQQELSAQRSYRNVRPVIEILSTIANVLDGPSAAS